MSPHGSTCYVFHLVSLDLTFVITENFHHVALFGFAVLYSASSHLRQLPASFGSWSSALVGVVDLPPMLRGRPASEPQSSGESSPVLRFIGKPTTSTRE